MPAHVRTNTSVLSFCRAPKRNELCHRKPRSGKYCDNYVTLRIEFSKYFTLIARRKAVKFMVHTLRKLIAAKSGHNFSCVETLENVLQAHAGVKQTARLGARSAAVDSSQQHGYVAMPQL